MSWAPIKPRPRTAPAAVQRRDFVALNAASVARGVHGPVSMARFRETTALTGEFPHRAPTFTGRRDRSRRVPEDVAFGSVSGAPEDLGAVLAHAPGWEWCRDRQRRHEAAEARTKAAAHKDWKKPLTTRTVELRHRAPELEPPFQHLSQRYASTAPVVDPWRDPAARERAHRTHAVTAPLSLGACYGHGIAISPAGTSRNL